MSLVYSPIDTPDLGCKSCKKNQVKDSKNQVRSIQDLNQGSIVPATKYISTHTSSQYSFDDNKPTHIAAHPVNNGSMFIITSDHNEEHDHDGEKERDHKEPNEIVNNKWDRITQFYFGSITIVGLYLIYRMQGKLMLNKFK